MSRSALHLICISITLALAAITPQASAKSFSYVIGNHGLVYEKHLALDTALRLEYYLKQKGIQFYLCKYPLQPCLET
jgi:hypothetical protein